jgi:hypothetical protein
LMLAMKPTPQESFSWRGSNRPFSAGTPGQSGTVCTESFPVRSAGEAERPTPTCPNRVLIVDPVMPAGRSTGAPLVRGAQAPRCKTQSIRVRGGLPPLAGPSRDRSSWRCRRRSAGAVEARPANRTAMLSYYARTACRCKSEHRRNPTLLALCCPARWRDVTRGPRSMPQRNRIAWFQTAQGAGPDGDSA